MKKPLFRFLPYIVMWIALLSYGFYGGGSGAINDAELTAISGLTSAADKIIQFTGSGTAGLLDFAYKSDCSGITAGMCLDTDDGVVYTWNGASVVAIAFLSQIPTDFSGFSDTLANLETALSVNDIAQLNQNEIVGGYWSHLVFRGTLATGALGSIATRDFFWADPDNYDPAGIGGSIDYISLKTSGGYKGVIDADGNLLVNTSQASGNVITDADGITLTASQMNSTIVMTGAGDVDIPADQCDTATGKWLIVKSTAAHLNSLTSNDTSDQFVTSDGTALAAQNELDLGGAAGNQATVMCLQANKWWVIGEIGTCVDGGAAD